MKETEFAKLLGDLPENYILQAQAHRSGGRYAVGARRPVLKFAAVAAAAALMLGGFFWGNATGNSLEKNVSISSDGMFASDSVSLPRLDNPTGHVRHTGDNGRTFWQH